MNLKPLLHPPASPARRAARPAWRLAALAGLVAVLGGCASPGSSTPRAHLIGAQQLGLQAGAADFPTQDWWKRFGDAGLDRLEQQALAGSPGLQQAQAREREAQAATGVARSALLPHVGAALSSTRERFSANDIYPPPLGGSIYTENQLALQGSWELDFFGRNRARLRAAVGQARAAQAQAQAARVLITSDVAAEYFRLAGLVEQERVLRDSLAQRETIARLVGERARVGLDNTLQQRQAQAQIPQLRVSLEANLQAQQQARDALAALIGAGPQATAGLHPQLRQVPLPQLPRSLPASLIGRRADVVAARWQVQSALASVDEARASFYPDINLSAFVGFTSLGFSQFLAAGSRAWGVGPAVDLPIFEGGALRANLRARDAGADAAIDEYNATLVGAVREVADAVAQRRSAQAQIHAQRQALRLAGQAHRLARERFDAGLGNELMVLQTQEPVLQLRQLGAQLKTQALVDDVALIRALGGGYGAAAEAGAPAAAVPVSAKAR